MTFLEKVLALIDDRIQRSKRIIAERQDLNLGKQTYYRSKITELNWLKQKIQELAE